MAERGENMFLPNLVFNDAEQHYQTTDDTSVEAMIASMHMPLSLTFQLTRGCNFRCIYCSEPPGIRSRKYENMLAMLDKLQGMRRIIFSGGEPMLHNRFWDILEYAQGKFEKIVLSTNASRIGREEAKRLKDLVAYVDVTVDGPRRQHNMIRGNYHDVLRGLIHLASEEIPLSVICVLLSGNWDAMHYICQTADALGAIKVKILTPIPKGMSVNIFQDFVTGDTLARIQDFLQKEKEKNGWKVRITISDWMKIGKGHAILVEPDGRMIASPVWDTNECLLPFGNLAESSIEDLWKAYPFKENHLKKYLEHTLLVT